MKNILLLSVFFLLISLSGVAAAQEIAVIVSKDNTNNIDRSFINKVYMGSVTRWPDGGNIKIYEPNEGDPHNAAFAKKVMNRPPQALKDNWATLVFTGKNVPPTQLSSDDDIIRAVAGNKKAIGYVDASKVDSRVRTVYQVQ